MKWCLSICWSKLLKDEYLIVCIYDMVKWNVYKKMWFVVMACW